MPYADPIAAYHYHDAHRQESAAPDWQEQAKSLAQRIEVLHSMADLRRRNLEDCSGRELREMAEWVRGISFAALELVDLLDPQEIEAAATEEEAGEEVIASAA